MEADNKNAISKLAFILFALYLGVLFWILVLKFGVRFSYMDNRAVNLIPFKGLLITSDEIDISEWILNTIIFIPLGIYSLVIFQKWTFRVYIFFFILISLTIETLQFTLKIGAFDATDIITNTLGGLIGLITLKSIEKLYGNNSKARKFIIVLAAFATVLIIVLLILLKLDMLPIKYQ